MLISTINAQSENNDYLPFLDLKIIKNNKKLEFGIFRKDTHANNYIKANSYNRVTHKHAIINSVAYKLINMPLSSVGYKEDYNRIIETAEKNGFEKTLVDKKIKAQNRFKHIKNNTTLETLTKKDTIYKKITYQPLANNKFQKCIKKGSISLWHLLINLTSKT